MKSWLLSQSNNLLLALIAVLSPVKPLLLTVGFLIAVDFIIGLFRAHKTGEEITSRKMGNTVSKMLLYNLAILSVYFLDHYILTSGLNLEKIAAGLIAVIEIKSFDESFKTIFGFSIWDKLKKIIKRGASTTKDVIEEE